MDKQLLTIEETISSLHKYCICHSYKGYDVADGIESPFISKTPLKKSPFFRLLFQQLTAHKFSYLNLRPILFIPKKFNAKGIALFLNGYCNIYKNIKYVSIDGINEKTCLETINNLAKILISLRSKGKDYYGWGYPMGWQGRLDFFWPANTPTVVASSFAVDALLNAYEITKIEEYKKIALSTVNFVLKDLRRTSHKNGFFFSYSALNGHDGVYNASLLGARILLQCYKYTCKDEYLVVAKQAIETCVEEQNEDGSWYYGVNPKQKWIDNFHTGYNLEAISEYKKITGDSLFDDCISRGVNFMIKNHFDNNGIPKYYHNKQYPIDIHCCGELYTVFYKLGIFKDNEKLADTVFFWTLNNMYNKSKGYFYFQKRNYLTVKVPLMRWSEAFMMNALSYYLMSKIENEGVIDTRL